jgi:hypothetical protein
MEKMHRPLGVTIIAILTIISGILLLLGGVSLIAIGALISVTHVDTTATTTNSQPIAQFFGVISAAIGSVLLAIGIGYLVRTLKRKRLVMDYNNNIASYRNCNSNDFNYYWSSV